MFKIILLLGLILVIFPCKALADGFIIPDPLPDVEHVPLPAIKYHRVRVDINDQIVTTEIDQVFVNEFHRDLEGTYIFPLPEEASISEFSMFVDGEKLTGRLLDKDEARRIYEDIVRRRRDPAILEYVGRNMFQARIFPIPAGGEKRVQLKYNEILKKDNNLLEYIYPLDTERFSSKPLEDVTIYVKITSSEPIKTVYSPSHTIAINRIDDYQASLSYEDANIYPDKDFLLYYTVSPKDIGLSLLTYNDGRENGFFLLMASPKFEIPSKRILGKDIVFVFDTSGSMSGDKIEQAKGALEFVLSHLNPDDRFNVITFNTDIYSFWNTLVPAEKSRIKEASGEVKRMEALGGTNIDQALREGLALFSSGNRPRILVFLTDGLPTVGETNIKRIIDNVNRENRTSTRIFVFGVGYNVNTKLLDKISGENGGISDYIQPGEDIEIKVSHFYSKISSPVLSNLKLDFGGIRVAHLYPQDLPDLFKGSQLILLGRYRDIGTTGIKLSGDVGEEIQNFVYEANFPAYNMGTDFIPRLWASRRIGYLLDEIRLSGENRELVEEIVQLSKRYGIITPYTSFLVEERVSRMRDEDLFHEAEEAMAPMAKDKGGGKAAVDRSLAFKEMKVSDKIAPPEVEGLGGVAGEAREVVKYVKDRTFYLRNEIWTDSEYSEGEKTIKIEYMSEAYFQLLATASELGDYFALGERVIVKLGENFIEVGPEGKSVLSEGELEMISGK